MTRNQEVLVWVSGALDELNRAGLIAKSVESNTTPKGLAIFDQLKAGDFQPTEAEVKAAMCILLQKDLQQLDPTMVRSIHNFRETLAVMPKVLRGVFKVKFKESMSKVADPVDGKQKLASIIRTYFMGWVDGLESCEQYAGIREFMEANEFIKDEHWLPDDSWNWW